MPLKRPMRCEWTQEIEEKFIELWQEHECLFDVSSNLFHNRSEKERRWREIAKSLQMPVAQIKTRALSLRTQYSRLIKPKLNGSVNKSYTARQRWLLRVMDFLKQYIVHRSCEFTRILPSTVKEETDNQDECDLEKYSASFEHSQEPSSRPASPSTASPSHTSSPLPSPAKEFKARGVRHGGRTAYDVELQKLVVLKKLAATVNADSTCDAFTTFGNQVASELRQIRDPANLITLKRNIMNMIYDTQDAERS